MPNPILKQAVVIGAGMGGLTAAKAVAAHFEKVIVFDRDALPDAPEPRPGDAAGAAYAWAPSGRLPRARASVSRHRARSRRGRRRSDARSPRYTLRGSGFRSSSAPRLRFRSIRPVAPRAGARLPSPGRTGAQYRVQTAHARTELIASSDNRGAAGVRFEDTRGKPGSLAADLVVDASGRASPTLRFLEAIGSAKPAAIEIGIDQAYATAVFEKPEDAPTDWLLRGAPPTPPGSSRLGSSCPWRIDDGASRFA